MITWSDLILPPINLWSLLRQPNLGKDMNQQEQRDAEIKARQEMRLYHKVWRENNKEHLRQYEKERYQKQKNVVN